jgi:hypothetical protein
MRAVLAAAEISSEPVFRAMALDGRVSDADLKGQGRRAAAHGGYRPLMGRPGLTGRSGTASGFQPAMVLAHRRASALSVMPGNSRRSSTAADNSPPRLNAARIAAASASVTTNIEGGWEREGRGRKGSMVNGWPAPARARKLAVARLG